MKPRRKIVSISAMGYEDELSLPRHAFPLGNLALEQTKFFGSVKGKGYPNILVGFRDPGPANAQIPVLAKIKELANIYVVADSMGQRNFEEAKLGFKQYTTDKIILLQIASLVDQADVIFTTKSDGSGTELAFMANAQWGKVKKEVQRPQVVELEDYPGCIARYHYGKLDVPKWVCPDIILAISEWGKRKELEFLPEGFDPKKIIITGQPNFDRLADENVEEVRAHVRGKLRLGDRPVVVHMGTLPMDVTIGTLKILQDCLEQDSNKDATLIVRPHPRDTDGIVECERVCSQSNGRIMLGTNDQMTQVLDIENNKIGDALGMAADVIFHHGSTAGIEAVYRGVPAVNVFISEPPKSHHEVLENYPLPIVEDGASPLATTKEELRDILYMMFYDQSYVSQLRAKMSGWKVDGLATNRVAKIVLDLAKEHYIQRQRTN